MGSDGARAQATAAAGRAARAGLMATMVAASLICATVVTPSLAADKTAAQYEAEAAAWEAKADRLLQAPPARPAPRLAPAAPLVLVASAAPAGGGLRVGVYGCMNQDGYETPTLQWGILDGASYSDFDGGRGRYVYSAATQVLTFTSGPFKGLRRLRTDERAFRVLDEHGAMTAFNCPWTPKDPRNVHW
jgi:hypothetical protein